MEQNTRDSIMQLRMAMDNLSVKLFEVGHNRLNPFYEEKDMTYKYYKSYYIESGNVDIYIKDQVYSLSPGDLVMTPADTYIYYCKGTVKNVMRYWCSFNLIYPRNLIKFRPDMVKRKCPKEDIIPIFESMILHSHHNSITDILSCKASMMQLLSLLFQDQGCESILTEGQDDFYHTINSYINSHIRDQIVVAELAELVHFEPSYFTKVFRKSFFNSPNKYINELKLDHCAKMLLMNHEMKIEDIAHEYGFHDYRYFSRIFKQHYGVSPQAFQRREY